MAQRARLTPPQEEQTQWPWHTVESASLPASLMFRGDRRMEARHLLATGFISRAAIEAQKGGWTPLQELAEVWQPGRLKGIQVPMSSGTPFLSATQVFDARPLPRKWLSPQSDSEACGASSARRDYTRYAFRHSGPCDALPMYQQRASWCPMTYFA